MATSDLIVLAVVVLSIVAVALVLYHYLTEYIDGQLTILFGGINTSIDDSIGEISQSMVTTAHQQDVFNQLATIQTNQSVHSLAFKEVREAVEAAHDARPGDSVLLGLVQGLYAKIEMMQAPVVDPTPPPDDAPVPSVVDILDAVGRLMNPQLPFDQAPDDDPDPSNPARPWEPGMPIPAEDDDDPMADSLIDNGMKWLDDAARAQYAPPVEHARPGWSEGGFMTGYGPDAGDPPMHEPTDI